MVNNSECNRPNVGQWGDRGRKWRGDRHLRRCTDALDPHRESQRNEGNTRSQRGGDASVVYVNRMTQFRLEERIGKTGFQH